MLSVPKNFVIKFLKQYREIGNIKPLPIYIIAMLSGLVSTIPGGLGVFEAVIMFFLGSIQTKEVLLSNLLIFRCLYYFLPFTIAVLALIIFEIYQNLHSNKF